MPNTKNRIDSMARETVSVRGTFARTFKSVKQAKDFLFMVMRYADPDRKHITDPVVTTTWYGRRYEKLNCENALFTAHMSAVKGEQGYLRMILKWI